MKTHYLTTLINDYERCLNGSKNFEIRSNDRDFQTGDEVLLQEYDAELNQFTGATLKCTITYVLYNHDMLSELPTHAKAMNGFYGTFYKINTSQFIRDAINEKLQREKNGIISQFKEVQDYIKAYNECPI
jgi:hypothetical protein